METVPLVVGKQQPFSLYTKKNFPILFIIGTFDFLAAALPSIVAPFFPEHAIRAFNASSTQVALVFSLFQIFVMLCSPLASLCCIHFGRPRVLLLSQIVTAVSTIAFGYAESIYTCMIYRTLQGLGVSGTAVSVMAIINDKFPNNEAQVVGFMEGMVGLGFASGPVLGSFLFASVGYATTFLIIGLAPIVLFSFSYTFLLKSLRAQQCQRPISTTRTSWSGFTTMLSSPKLCAGLFSASLSMCAFGVLDPLLQVHLNAVLDLSPRGIGLFFSLIALTYTVTCPVVGVMVKYFQSNLVVLQIGFGLLILAFSCFGPVPLDVFNNPTAAWITQTVACILFGLGAAMSFVPCLPIVQANRPLSAIPNQQTDYTMGLFTAATYFGEGIGPLVGAILMEGLPERTEINCDPERAVNHCSSSFSNAAIAFCLILLVCLIVIQCILRK